MVIQTHSIELCYPEDTQKWSSTHNNFKRSAKLLAVRGRPFWSATPTMLYCMIVLLVLIRSHVTSSRAMLNWMVFRCAIGCDVSSADTTMYIPVSNKVQHACGLLRSSIQSYY
eukprot:scaffold3670_cov124-Cylindrotheca_fusiformis.AAC.15